jgi:outer membrane protein OmpA-like peptidoglycan-associated protein
MRGVARARMGIRGYGESQPIASNETEDGRSRNRRVEIKVVPVTQPGY